MVFKRGPATRYLGLSSDAKPLKDTADQSAILPGSEFLEIDTGATFFFDGFRWISVVPDSTSARDEMLAEHRKTNELLELILGKF